MHWTSGVLSDHLDCQDWRSLIVCQPSSNAYVEHIFHLALSYGWLFIFRFDIWIKRSEPLSNLMVKYWKVHRDCETSVLWHCWLGGRKGIWPVKNCVVGCWRDYVWSEVQNCIWPSWCHCHSLSLASVKSRLVLPFWYRLTWVVPYKGPLNRCVRLSNL